MVNSDQAVDDNREMPAALEDPFDYPLSDLFVSETRARPYRLGFRSRRHFPETIEDLNALPDREFDRWVRAARPLPVRPREQSYPATNDHRRIARLEAEVGQLRNQVFALMRSLATKTPAANFSGPMGGLDVTSRA